jgi:ABC-type nickel/cobalt efflux system permease component RcnA
VIPTTLADGLRRHGFRKWYERELLIGHAHLALLLLCCVGLMLALEAAFRFRTPQDQVIDLVAVVLCAGAGLWSLRRYLRLLMRAETIAHQADCPACQAYGRLALVDPTAQGDDVAVSCRACGHRWRIEG